MEENGRRALRGIVRTWATLLIYAGVLLTLLTLAVDRLSMSTHAGFGWRQITGTEIGVLILAVGFLAGWDLLGIAGLFLLVLSVGADVLNVGHAPGLGWRKLTALAVACVLIIGGALGRKAAGKRDADS
jgi:uracil DNA glycosylase